MGQLNGNHTEDSTEDIENFTLEINEVQWNGFQNFSYNIASDFNAFLGGDFYTLDPVDCLDAYAQEFQSYQGHLYIVTADNVTYLDPNLPAVLNATYVPNMLPRVDPYSWMCNQLPSTDTSLCSDHISSFRANISDWQPFGYPVSYCLNQDAPSTEQCRVQIDLTIAMIVGIVILAQVVIMFIAMFIGKGTLLLTHGDAVLSFLEDPDPGTESMCLLEKTDVARFKVPKKTSQPPGSQPRKWLSSPKPFVAARKRWHTAVGKARWISFVFL